MRRIIITVVIIALLAQQVKPMDALSAETEHRYLDDAYAGMHSVLMPVFVFLLVVQLIRDFVNVLKAQVALEVKENGLLLVANFQVTIVIIAPQMALITMQVKQLN